MKIIDVRVYPDDSLPDCMLGMCRVGGVEVLDEDNKSYHKQELVDNKEFHSTQEMLDSVAIRLQVSREIVHLDGE